MLQSIALWFKTLGREKCELPTKDDCPFAHRFAHIGEELTKIGTTLGDLQKEVRKLLDRE